MQAENYEIVGSYDNQRFPNIDAARSINLFEYVDLLGKKPRCLISTSGLQDASLEFPNAAPTDGFRMEYVLNGFEYFVIGPNLYRRNSLDVVQQLNASDGSEPIAFTGDGYVGVDANNADNGPQIMIVDGQLGHIYDTGTGIFTYDVNSVDPSFPQTPIDVAFIDGFLVVPVGGTNDFRLSGFNNAYSWGLVSNTFTADPGPGPFADTLIVSTVMPTGTQFQVSTAGVLPAPLVAATTYYAIFVDDTHIRVAATFLDALSNTFINIATAGTPPNTITNAGINATATQPFAPGQLQQGSINSHPGNIVACRTLHRRLFLFSSNFTEVWENAGAGTNLPLRPNSSLLMEYGTPSIGSIVTGFDKMIFLSQDRDGLGSVMEVRGTESIPISNRALDFQLAQYAQAGQITDARGIFIKENGIIFYRLNFTEANHTFVYNDTLSNPSTEEGKLWHEEQVLNGDRHPAQTHGYFNGNNYYGSFDSPVLYQVDQSFVTNNGEIIPRIRIGRCKVPALYNRTRIDRFVLDAIQGQTNITNLSGILNLLTENSDVIDTENSIPIILEESTLSPIYDTNELPIFLSYSKDGGVTFGYRLTGYLGAMGDRTHRTVWRKLGVIPQGQGYVPKIEFFGTVPLVILGASWFFEVMPQ